MDSAYRPLSLIVESLLSFQGDYVEETMGVHTYITACEIESPLELEVSRAADGSLLIGSTPPLYPLMTTVTPVFHRLRFVSELASRVDDRE